MKAKYKRKHSKWEITLMAGITLLFFGFGLIQLIKYNNIAGIICLVPLTSFIFSLFLPLVKINERDVLVLGTIPVDIHQVISLEEGKKQGIVVRYLFQGEERVSGTIRVSDKDAPRLVADLLSINPGIEVKAASLLPPPGEMPY